jgi:hypothetical protein
MSKEIALRYDLSAALQKWDSVERVRTGDILRAGNVSEGTLADCVRQFMSKPIAERSLYEILTEQQPGLSTTILGPTEILEIAQRPDFPAD